MRGEAEPERAADEAPQVLLGDVLGSLFGEERRAEPRRGGVRRSRRRPRSRARRPALRSPTAPPGSDTRRRSGTRRRGRRRRPTATPRGQNSVPITTLTAQPSATSSIRTTPDLPSNRDDQVEQDRDHHRERRLTDGERRRARRVRGHEHRDRERDPQRGLVAADRDHKRPADHEPERGSGECPERGRAGRRRRSCEGPTASRARPRSRAEPWSHRRRHRHRERHRSADAVDEPDRSQARVRCAPRWRRSTLAARSARRRPIRCTSVPPLLEPLGVGEPATRSASRRRRRERRRRSACAWNEIWAASRKAIRPAEPAAGRVGFHESRHDRLLTPLELIDVRVCIAAGEQCPGVSQHRARDCDQLEVAFRRVS